MRKMLVAAMSLAATSTLHAETLTLYEAAPGQAALSLERYQSPLPGSEALDLDVGIGSAAFRDPSAPANTFYTMSDRGPNFTCDDAADLMKVKADDICPAVEGQKAGSGRIYPVPGYNVSIYQVTLDPASKTYTVSGVIPLKTPKGNPITGLTNPLKVAKTDKPRDGAGQPLAQDVNAIDAEGLVKLPDGRFFIGEENATGIVEVSADGVITRRFVPAGTEQDFAAADYPISGTLPAILSMRHSNRGIESLALGDDGKTLYAMVQNPLDNPDSKAYGKAINTRFFKIEVGESGGATTLTPVAEYVYQLDDWKKYCRPRRDRRQGAVFASRQRDDGARPRALPRRRAHGPDHQALRDRARRRDQHPRLEVGRSRDEPDTGTDRRPRLDRHRAGDEDRAARRFLARRRQDALPGQDRGACAHRRRQALHDQRQRLRHRRREDRDRRRGRGRYRPALSLDAHPGRLNAGRKTR